MAENYRTPEVLPQTSLGEFTASPTVIHDFHFVKVIITLYRLCPSKE